RRKGGRCSTGRTARSWPGGATCGRCPGRSPGWKRAGSATPRPRRSRSRRSRSAAGVAHRNENVFYFRSTVEFNLADLFESVVDAIPDREALVCGDRRLTYRQLEERANRLAHHLQRAGLEPGQHVGLYLYNGTEYVEAMLAC